MEGNDVVASDLVQMALPELRQHVVAQDGIVAIPAALITLDVGHIAFAGKFLNGRHVPQRRPFRRRVFAQGNTGATVCATVRA